jgi:hypothetical protein
VIVGVALDRTYRVIALAIIQKEDAAHFHEVLRIVLTAVIHRPKVIMSDADDAMGLAVEALLPGSVYLSVYTVYSSYNLLRYQAGHVLVALG